MDQTVIDLLWKELKNSFFLEYHLTVGKHMSEFRALSNLRWQHIVHLPCFRQYTRCKDAETYIASKIEYEKPST